MKRLSELHASEQDCKGIYQRLTDGQFERLEYNPDDGSVNLHGTMTDGDTLLSEKAVISICPQGEIIVYFKDKSSGFLYPFYVADVIRSYGYEPIR